MKSTARISYLVLMGASVFLTQGCLATRDWVREQVDPISGRVAHGEQRLDQAEGKIGGLDGRVGGAEGKLGQIDGRLGALDARTERALNALANLRLERRFVIDLKEGANFAFNSSSLPAHAKKEIDGFISDLKGDTAGMDGAMFLVAGHTDSAGSEDYNYELGKKRADAVSRYLITQKKMDPLRVVTVSYGENAPVAENKTTQGRAKNRRVEILVYRDGITSSAAASAVPQAEPRADQPMQQPMGERFTQR